jgi:hypothetical protein
MAGIWMFISVSTVSVLVISLCGMSCRKGMEVTVLESSESTSSWISVLKDPALTALDYCMTEIHLIVQ